MRRWALWRLALAAIALASPASAVEWRLVPDESALEFRYEENAKKQSGVFRKFDARGRFDEAVPQAAEVTLTIDVASIKLPDVLRESVVKGVGWFEAQSHPTAVFHLMELRALGDDRYEAAGVLTIKETARRLITTAELQITEDRARARGEITFSRKDFRLGGGPEELFFDIGDDVTVSFDLVATTRR